jgi:RHS repeat-associated protein
VAEPTFNPDSENTYPSTSVSVTISTATTGAQIRYTLDGSTPSSTNGTLINGSTGQTSSFNTTSQGKTLNAIAFKSGYTDSAIKDANYWYDNGQFAPMSASSSSQTIIFSVWDGDWAILEEYDASGAVVQKYLQGYHGLVKTLVDNMYYYQDELGSTSHIADSTGSLLEYYKYDLYGKPTYFDSTSQPLNSSTYGVKDLFTGQRWHSELGLYDDRNRFMSPDLGRFLQPDPIGFKGDASNLYRYCGNDWANRSDPMGTDGYSAQGFHYPDYGAKVIKNAENDERSFQEKLMAWEMHMEKGGADGQAARSDARTTEAAQATANAPNVMQASQGAYRATPQNLPEAAKDPKVAAELKRAWIESHPYDKEVYRDKPGSTKHEQGGWVVENPRWQFWKDRYSVIRGESGPRGKFYFPPKPEGAVMNFHTHPNTAAEGYRAAPDARDVSQSRSAGVPGLVLTHEGDFVIPP